MVALELVQLPDTMARGQGESTSQVDLIDRPGVLDHPDLTSLTIRETPENSKENAVWPLALPARTVRWQLACFLSGAVLRRRPSVPDAHCCGAGFLRKQPTATEKCRVRPA